MVLRSLTGLCRENLPALRLSRGHPELMAKKKVYAIAAGHQPGIYESWPEAEKQVKGFAGAMYKGFTDRAEAERWLAAPHYRQATAGRGRGPETAAALPVHRDGEINIYSDGGCRNNPGPGGYGAILVVDGSELEFSGGFRRTTNNRMELMGCIVALRALPRRDLPITVHSDSSYVVNGISKGWAEGWRKKGWIKSDRQPAVNPDLWAELLDLIDGLDIRFQWVKGHAGHPLNERCDQLAVAASKEHNPAEDTGYPGS
jgi:ribonuclease HI